MTFPDITLGLKGADCIWCLFFYFCSCVACFNFLDANYTIIVKPEERQSIEDGFQQCVEYAVDEIYRLRMAADAVRADCGHFSTKH